MFSSSQCSNVSGRCQVIVSSVSLVVTASSPTSTSPQTTTHTGCPHKLTELASPCRQHCRSIPLYPLHPLHLHPLNSYTLSPLTTLSHQSSPFCTLLSLVMHLTHSNITPNSLCTSYGIHIGCFGHNRT